MSLLAYSVSEKISIALTGLFGMYKRSFEDPYPGAMLCFFTTLSNVWVIVMFIVMSIVQIYTGDVNYYSSSQSELYPIIKGGFTFAILITFLVFHFILRPSITKYKSKYVLYSAKNITLHYMVPILTVVDYLIFDEKGRYK